MSWHQAYGEKRWALLRAVDQDKVTEAGWDGKLRDTGVGGMRPEGLVKCLHIHLAHELGARHEDEGGYHGVNLVGLWVVEALNSMGVSV